MIHAADLRVGIPVKIINRSTASASGFVDTKGADWATIVFVHGDATSAVVFAARHCSAKTTLFASATAFTTAISTSVATSGLTAYRVDLRTGGIKRFLRIRQFAAGTSCESGCFVLLQGNELVPSALVVSSTNGPATVSGFTALTEYTQ